MTTLEEPMVAFDEAAFAGTLSFSLSSHRRLRGAVLGAKPAFRKLKAKRNVSRVRALRHEPLSALLTQQWHNVRCASSWSRM